MDAYNRGCESGLNVARWQTSGLSAVLVTAPAEMFTLRWIQKHEADEPGNCSISPRDLCRLAPQFGLGAALYFRDWLALGLFGCGAFVALTSSMP